MTIDLAAFAKEKGESNWREAVEQLENMGVLRGQKDYSFEKTVSEKTVNRNKSALARRSLFASNAENLQQAVKSNSASIQGHVLKDAAVLKTEAMESKHVKDIQSPASTTQLIDRYKSAGQTLTQQLSNREGK